MLYVVFKFGDIGNFFVDYVSSSYTTHEIMIADKYISLFTYLVLILLIICNTIIAFLMKAKNKKNSFYLYSILYYVILIILTFLFYNTMGNIETDTMDSTFVNFVRDMARLSNIPCYLLMVIVFAKGIGFNFKTWRFDNNRDLQVTEEDEEEIELNIVNDSEQFKKNFTHTLRELKYYFFENKLVFTYLGGLLIFIIGISLYMNFQVYNKRYNLNQAFALDTFNLTLKESYITSSDLSGSKLADDTYFLAIKMGIQNKSRDKQILEKANFRITVDDEDLYPNFARSPSFIDIGRNYQGMYIPPTSQDDYVLVYELTEEQIKKQYKMKILSNLRKDANKLVPSYKIINIKPESIIKEQDIGKIDIGKKTTLKDTLLKNTEYELNNIQILTSYNYEYKHCSTKTNCVLMRGTIAPTSGRALIVIEDDIKWDETTSYFKNSKLDFYSDFASIVYEFETEAKTRVYEERLKNVTPNGTVGVKIYEASNMILKGSNMKLKIQIRNKVGYINF